HGYFTFHLYPQAGSTGGGSGGATETDPVYTVDKPLIALKTELPDISGKANKAEVTAVQAEVDGIKPLIPTQASPANQLSDKDFINSSIQNMAARYVTATSAGDTQFESLAALNEGQWFHQGQPYTPTVHDYAIFINTDNSVWRAGFDGAQWNAQYKINDTPFTAAQIAAINSGITSGLVTQMQELISNPPGGGGGQQLYLHKMTLSIIYSSSTSISDELIWINDHPIADFDPTAYDQNTYRLKFLNGMGPVPSGNFIKKLSDIRHGMVSSQYRFIQNISVGIMSNAFFKIIYLSTINASTGSITWSLNDTTAGSNLTLTNETITPFGVD
ncbi:MAG: hypothetical protein LBB81_08490, partial [Treponema sp.]|nr:hypothetical protein [Treponema sp.]